MSDSGALDQSEIERLLGGFGEGGAAPASAASSGPTSTAVGGDVLLSQDELQSLFAGSPSPPPLASSPVPPAKPSAAPPPTSFADSGKAAPAPSSSDGWGGSSVGAFDVESGEDEEGIPRGDLDYVAKKAEESLRSIGTSPLSLPVEVIEFQFPEFGGTVPSSEHTTLDQIGEVDLDVKVELGRTYMYIEDVLKLRRGSVVPLDKMAGETVDIYINGRLLARGEVLVMNDNFCVRVAELLAGAIPME